VARVRHALASVWSFARDLPKAEEQLKLILRDDPTHALACNDLAYHYAEMNRNLDEAEKLARKAIEQERRERTFGHDVGVDGDQDNGSFVDTLGWVLFRQGKLAEAHKELRRATELADGKESPVIWDHLGDVLVRMGDVAGATRAYETAFRLYEAEGRRRVDDAPAEIRKKLRLLQP
jgi:Flp pilus assembly protein TadD